MFKIILNNCCGLDVHKTWIYACVGITEKPIPTSFGLPGQPEPEGRFRPRYRGLLIQAHGCALDDEALIHSDQGCHYTSYAFIQKLKDADFVQFMSRKGNC